MFILIKLTQVNKLTYDCSSFLILNSVIYQCLSIIFTSIKPVSYSAWFFLFRNGKCNAEENTWPFERLDYYLEWEIQGMLKSFAIRRDKEIFTRILGQFSNIARSCFRLFRLVLVYYNSFLLIPACYGWLWVVPHFIQKIENI